jgi:hypothetical protein
MTYSLDADLTRCGVVFGHHNSKSNMPTMESLAKTFELALQRRSMIPQVGLPDVVVMYRVAVGSGQKKDVVKCI